MTVSTVLALLTVMSSPATPLAAIAGEYYSGDGLDVNWQLKLDGDGQFAFTWHGCLGLYAELHGRAELRDSVVTLRPRRPPAGDLATRLPTRLLVVPWAARAYLIPPDDVPDFENAVNLTWEPRETTHGRFLLRKNDWTHSVSGDPALPSTNLLLQTPVSGHVLEVLDSGSARTDIGSDAGVKLGQRFWLRPMVRSPSAPLLR